VPIPYAPEPRLCTGCAVSVRLAADDSGLAGGGACHAGARAPCAGRDFAAKPGGFAASGLVRRVLIRSEPVLERENGGDGTRREQCAAFAEENGAPWMRGC
jgi:hypothetical protein